jgi:hypothetical protein
MASWDGRWIFVLRVTVVRLSNPDMVLILRIVVELQLLKD